MANPVFDWSEYLKLANQLSANSDQASQRSSISRAYYCIYHKASERAVANGYRVQRHAELWAFYDRNTDKTCRKLGEMGSRMKKERVDADYKAVVDRLADRMSDQLNRANRFLEELTALEPDLPRP